MIVILFYSFCLIIGRKISVIICGVPFSIGLIGLMFKKVMKIPYCVFCYGGEYGKFKSRKMQFRLLERILQSASITITNSEYTSQEVKGFSIEPGKVVKLTPGVDTDRFRPGLDCSELREKLGLEDKKVLLTVSRLAKRKGIDTVISALPSIRELFPNVVYLVVGKGKEENYLKSLARERRLEKNVIFAGYVPDDELPKYYNLCDIYVMPNRETTDWDVIEGFGISFIEASACGKPAVGGVSGGAGEAVEDKKTGVLVNGEDVRMVAQTIIQLLGDEAYASQLGRSGRRRAEKEFRWENRAEKLEEICRRVTNR